MKTIKQRNSDYDKSLENTFIVLILKHTKRYVKP